MHVQPLIFVVVGVALSVVLIARTRRGEKEQRRLRIVTVALVVVLAALLAVDFVTMPEQRWVSGIGLVGALVALGGYGYTFFRRSNTRSAR